MHIPSGVSLGNCSDMTRRDIDCSTWPARNQSGPSNCGAWAGGFSLSKQTSWNITDGMHAGETETHHLYVHHFVILTDFHRLKFVLVGENFPVIRCRSHCDIIAPNERNFFHDARKISSATCFLWTADFTWGGAWRAGRNHVSQLASAFFSPLEYPPQTLFFFNTIELCNWSFEGSMFDPPICMSTSLVWPLLGFYNAGCRIICWVWLQKKRKNNRH